MTLSEWAQVEAFVAAAWPQARPMDREQVRMRYVFVKDLPLTAVLGEVERMAGAGREWPPNPGQIAAAVREGTRAPAPAVGIVIGLLEQAAGAFGARREVDALRWLDEQSPYAARAACELGWRQFCREGLHDPVVGGAVRQRLERSLRSAIRGLEDEMAERRVLPLVQDRIRALEAGAPQHSGLRTLSAEGLLTERAGSPVAGFGAIGDDGPVAA